MLFYETRGNDWPSEREEGYKVCMVTSDVNNKGRNCHGVVSSGIGLS